MKSDVQKAPWTLREWVLIAGVGNCALWLVVTFFILGGAAAGQKPYRLMGLRGGTAPHACSPILWYFNYAHTFTLFASIPLVIVGITTDWSRFSRGRQVLQRIRRNNFHRKKKVVTGRNIRNPGRGQAAIGGREVRRAVYRGAPRNAGSKKVCGLGTW